MKAENIENNDCLQSDSAQPELLEQILDKDNLNRAFKRAKANKGAPGIDGITVDEIGALVPNGMPGGVRGRRLVTASYSIG